MTASGRPSSAWLSACSLLARQQPWRTLPPELTFRFQGIAALRGRVALLSGSGGVTPGVVLFDADDGLLAELKEVEQPDARWRGAVAVALVPEHAIEPEVLAACREAGLVLPDGLVLHPHSRPSNARAITEVDLRALLAAIEAITQLFRQKGERIAREEQRLRLRTSEGEGIIHARPSMTPAPLVSGNVSLLVSDAAQGSAHGLRTLWMVVDERDAKASAARVGRVDAIRPLATPEGQTILFAEERGDLLGMIGPATVPDSFRTEVTARGGAVLALVVRPPPGRAPRKRDYLVWRTVGLRRADGELTPREEGAFAVDEEVLLLARSVGSASEDLLEIMRDVAPPNALVDARVQSFVDQARLVWNAVLLADHHRQPELLDELIRLGADDPYVQRLILGLVASKRARFPGDLRYIKEATASFRQDGSLSLSVAAVLREPQGGPRRG